MDKKCYILLGCDFSKPYPCFGIRTVDENGEFQQVNIRETRVLSPFMSAELSKDQVRELIELLKKHIEET